LDEPGRCVVCATHTPFLPVARAARAEFAHPTALFVFFGPDGNRLKRCFARARPCRRHTWVKKKSTPTHAAASVCPPLQMPNPTAPQPGACPSPNNTLLLEGETFLSLLCVGPPSPSSTPSPSRNSSFQILDKTCSVSPPPFNPRGATLCLPPARPLCAGGGG
jgi:hypothetical protein